MVEPVQTKHQKAIHERLLSTTLSEKEFAAFVRSYRVPPDTPDTPEHRTLMLLEQQPRQVIEPEERQDLLRFSIFNRAFDFAPYTSGRIFHQLGELRWERHASHVHVVYTGHSEYQPDWQDVRKEELDNRYKVPRAYFLFGKRLDKPQLERMKPAAQDGDFAEVRIPRLLSYPKLDTIEKAELVQLVVCEYIDDATGANIAYRFQELVAYVEKSKEQQKV